MTLKLSALLAIAVIGFGQQMPVIRVPVRLVRVPALVFSADGRLINGLQASDFRVLDNGRSQKLTLDTESNALSIAVVVQANRDVRDYVPFIARTGSLIDALLAGEAGETALVTCNDETNVAKAFGSGDHLSVDLSAAMKTLSVGGRSSRMLDAAGRAIELLRQRPPSRTRVLILIGQPMDRGSETTLDSIREQVEQESISVFALALPEVGKAFVSDTFTLEGLPRERGGFRAGADLKRLATVVDRTTAAQQNADPFSVLTAATGGTQMHFRKQQELEGALAAIGTQVRSEYVLSYTPDAPESGYHSIQVEVERAGAKVYARPGYRIQ